jgi:hypothetical protein
MEAAIIPSRILRLFTGDEKKQQHINILISTLCIIVFINILKYIPHFCLFKKIFFIPCPGCGIITSIGCLFKFDIEKSIQINPIGIFISVFYLMQLPVRIIVICGKIKYTNLLNNVSNIFSRFIITGLLLVWIIKLLNGGNLWQIKFLVPNAAN